MNQDTFTGGFNTSDRVHESDNPYSHSYSGHEVLLSGQKRGWQDTRYGLNQFGKSIRTARRRYLDDMREGEAQGRRADITGGGLVRSLGGWSEVQRMRKLQMGKLKGDERTLGDQEKRRTLARWETKLAEIIGLGGGRLDNLFQFVRKGA